MTSVDPWLNRVVVGVDGSDTSKRAAGWAAAEAQTRNIGLTLVHSILPPVSATGFGPGIPLGFDVLDQMRQAARAELDAIAATLPATDVVTRVDLGSPSGVLLTASETAEMVVLGSRGLGGFRGLLLGSISTQVSAHADCPVVVIREDVTGKGQRVVVGVDGSPESEAAVGFAFEMASRHGWSVLALHAWDIPSYDLIVLPNTPIPVPLSDVADDEVRLAAEALAGFQADYPDVTVEQRLVRATPVQAILEATAEAAMVVVGTRGHGQLVGALLGSVSNGVLHRAQIPVAVVPYVPASESVA